MCVIVRMSFFTFSAGVLSDSYNVQRKVERKVEIAARMLCVSVILENASGRSAVNRLLTVHTLL